MSTPFDDRLYNLLPSVYRQRDSDFGEPLRALLAVIAEQADRVEQDIEGLYRNWFIETCDDWVVPYIGDLIGYRSIHDAGEPLDESAQRAVARTRILVPRRDVANTLRYRRRKGTLALLDDVAMAVSGWPAQAVEFERLLACTQSLQHVRLAQGGTANVRRANEMTRIGLASDTTAHLPEVRRPQSRYRQGRYNLSALGLFVWRLRSYAVTRTEAYCAEGVALECFTFSVLGNDCVLYATANGPATGDRRADATPLPIALRRADIATADGHVDPRRYGEGGDFALYAGSGATQPVPVGALLVADLSKWDAELREGTVAVDPELGRLMFAPGEAPEEGLFVSYSYGFSTDMGGGAYPRAMPGWALASPTYTVGSKGDFPTLDDALKAWHKDKPSDAIIELSANDVIVKPIKIALNEGQSLELRAAEGMRPVIRLLDWQAHRSDYMAISGEAGSRLVLDGLLLSGRGVQVKGPLGNLTIRHCTLVPGWTIAGGASTEGGSRGGAEPSLALVRTRAQVRIQHSILGPIIVTPEEPEREPLQVSIADSIVDATLPRHEALGAPENGYAHVMLTMARVTVFGRVKVNALALAENCIFNDGLDVERRQIGCVRFCYVPEGSATPRRYECQPDSGLAMLAGAERVRTAQRIRPMFTGVRYGEPGYCQLADSCATEISQGADDRSEMGVLHDLYQPQRLANLLARLYEYAPVNADVGVVMVS